MLLEVIIVYLSFIDYLVKILVFEEEEILLEVVGYSSLKDFLYSIVYFLCFGCFLGL